LDRLQAHAVRPHSIAKPEKLACNALLASDNHGDVILERARWKPGGTDEGCSGLRDRVRVCQVANTLVLHIPEEAIRTQKETPHARQRTKSDGNCVT
jgi:hypothetical protein